MTSGAGAALPPGRVLGLDVGDRRIGVAISDPEQRIAVPLPTLSRDGRGGELEALRRLAANEEAAAVVVGLPLSLSGEDSAQTQSARDFALRVEELTGRPVYLWDERLSSVEAARASTGPGGRPGRRERARRPPADIDAVAATIILQSFLDSRSQAWRAAP